MHYSYNAKKELPMTPNRKCLSLLLYFDAPTIGEELLNVFASSFSQVVESVFASREMQAGLPSLGVWVAPAQLYNTGRRPVTSLKAEQ